MAYEKWIAVRTPQARHEYEKAWKVWVSTLFTVNFGDGV